MQFGLGAYILKQLFDTADSMPYKFLVIFTSYISVSLERHPVLLFASSGLSANEVSNSTKY